MTFDGCASSYPDGTVSRYEWDLDGDGTFETTTGSNPSASRSFASAGPVEVGLRVTDDGGASGVTSHTVTVATGGRWRRRRRRRRNGSDRLPRRRPRQPEPARLLAPRREIRLDPGRSGRRPPGDALGGPTLGVPGAVAGDTDTAVRFDGVNDAATAPLTLCGRTAITLEFWMKWNAWANNDELAMEYTPNFNDNPGGFLVDPNSSYGSSRSGSGRGASRNLSLFARPTAGAWHHYAFVLEHGRAGGRTGRPLHRRQSGRIHQGRERHRRGQLRRRRP